MKLQRRSLRGTRYTKIVVAVRACLALRNGGGVAIAYAFGALFLSALTQIAVAQNVAPNALKPQQNQNHPYEDLVLSTEAQAEPTAEELQQEQDNLRGLARSLRLDYQLAEVKTGSVKSRTNGLSAATVIDTPHFGALALTLNLSAASASGTAGDGNGIDSSKSTVRRGLWRIDQRGMPFNDGWLGHHAIGTINTIVTPLARGFNRLTLPTAPIEGITAQYQRPGTDVNASIGRLGLFSGRDLDGFNASGGSLLSLGGQTRIGGAVASSANPPIFRVPRIDVAAQFLQSLAVSQGLSANTANTTNEQNSTSLYLSGAWQGRAPWAPPEQVSTPIASSAVAERVHGLQTQAGLVISRVAPSSNNSTVLPSHALGVWQDLSWRSPVWRQAASLYYFQPNLAWGNSLLPGDLQGVMYRAETATRQLALGFSGELNSRIQTIKDATRDASLFATVNARYRINADVGINSALTLRTGDARANSVQLTLDHVNRYGTAQWRSNWLSTAKSEVIRFGFDQGWKIGTQDIFSTSLSYEIDRSATRQDGSWIWNAIGTLPVPFTSSATLSGSIGGTSSTRRTRGDGGSNGASVTAVSDDFFTASTRNIALQLAAPLSKSWSLSASYNVSSGRTKRDTTLLSPFEIASTPVLPNFTETGSVLLLLRYGATAGTSQAPLGRKFAGNGAMVNVGAGRIEGTVFFDNNADGVRQADEGGAANVTLLLNGRYLARSNQQGRYVFDYVATGEQQVEIVPDNVPLPWSPKDRDAVKVIVLVRETTTANFALQR
jgi:hypothetical protein